MCGFVFLLSPVREKRKEIAGKTGSQKVWYFLWKIVEKLYEDYNWNKDVKGPLTESVQL